MPGSGVGRRLSGLLILPWSLKTSGTTLQGIPAPPPVDLVQGSHKFPLFLMFGAEKVLLLMTRGNQVHQNDPHLSVGEAGAVKLPERLAGVVDQRQG